MNRFRKIVDKAQRHGLNRSTNGSATLTDDDDWISLDTLGATGIPASATTVTYDSIQRLLLVRCSLASRCLHEEHTSAQSCESWVHAAICSRSSSCSRAHAIPYALWHHAVLLPACLGAKFTAGMLSHCWRMLTSAAQGGPHLHTS